MVKFKLKLSLKRKVKRLPAFGCGEPHCNLSEVMMMMMTAHPRWRKEAQIAGSPSGLLQGQPFPPAFPGVARPASDTLPRGFLSVRRAPKMGEAELPKQRGRFNSAPGSSSSHGGSTPSRQCPFASAAASLPPFLFPGKPPCSTDGPNY